MSAAAVFIIAAAGVLLGDRRRLLAATARTPAFPRPSPACAPHPAPVQRRGDLAPIARGRSPARQGRERDRHARVPGARADEPAPRNSPAGAVRARDAAARGDRATSSPRRASAVDSRVGRGRSARDALRKLLDEESFDRIIVSADEDPRAG